MSKSKKWIIRDNGESHAAVSDAAGKLAETLSLSLVTARLLCARGYDTPETADRFLKNSSEYFHDPFLMNDMDKAVSEVLGAIERGKHITVYGDYDVDGVTSVSVLYLYLKKAGASVDYYIPNRANEGYGVNREAIDKLRASGTELIITVDTGITAFEEAEYIKELGMSMVITDHHKCRDTVPCADAVINPKRCGCAYPFKELAGVGVVFKLLTALEFTVQERRLFPGKDNNRLTSSERIKRLIGTGQSDFLEKVCRDYIDLVAIGTIADVMTLTDENRLICAMGLKLMEDAPRLGVQAISDAAAGISAKKYQKKRRLTASYIGFTVAPRVNAAGRIDDASLGVELFTCAETDTARAAEIAQKLCELNTQRQAEETRIEEEALALAERTHDFSRDPVLVLAKENWHHGVIGIVSSRMTEKFNLPSILISIEDGVGKGSGRSIKGFNIIEALGHCGELLIRYGGHELAAGLTVSVDKIDEFRKKINEYASDKIDPEDNAACIDIDCVIDGSDIDIGLAEELTMFEPCGTGNPTPVFLMKGAEVSEVVRISEGRHTKLTVCSGGSRMTALLFGVSPEEADFECGDLIDLVFRLDINEFRGIRSVQLLVLDARLCSSVTDNGRTETGKRTDTEKYRSYTRSECEFLKRVESGEGFTVSDGLLPDRDDFAAVYRMIRGIAGKEKRVFSLYRLSLWLDDFGREIRPAKLKLILEILSDVGLIGLEQLPTESLSGSELYAITAASVSEKVNLFGTPRYKSVKAVLRS